MKISTLIIKVTHLSNNKIKYVSKTDLVPIEYSYHIPADSLFPYNQLQLDYSYTLISVKPADTWYWYYTYNLSNSQTLMDATITKMIKEQQ